jgi:hypothetical protein
MSSLERTGRRVGGGLVAGLRNLQPSSGPLRGRDRECAILDGLLKPVRKGYGGVLLHCREPGIGKTALLRFDEGIFAARPTNPRPRLHIADRRSVLSVQSDNPAPTYADRPIGIDATGTRTEFDSLGTVEVPADRYWGAQTQRSLQHSSIGNDHMPMEVYRAYGLIKKACALVNERAGRLEPWRARVIV